jgi:peptidoglycan/LPS O-acetylase OafA/YrhL
MQYFLRFYFACVVVMSHLWSDAFGSSGSYAVCGFFTISGYVITKVLRENYFQIDNGLRKFWINRVLRLYPSFILVSLFGYCVARLYAAEALALNVGLVTPESHAGQSLIAKSGVAAWLWPLFYIPNITMIGLQSPWIWMSPITLAPTATTTNVELYYYAVLGLGAAATAGRARRFLWTSLALLALLPVLYFLHGLGLFRYGVWAPGISVNAYSLFYKTILGWTYFFALGAAAYYVPKRQFSASARAAVVGVCLLFPFIYVRDVHLMIALRVAFGACVASLLAMFSDDRSNPVIRFLGEVSYPLFLIHWPVAAIIAEYTGYSKNNPWMLLYASVVSLALSAVLVFFVERPIERLRGRFRT